MQLVEAALAKEPKDRPHDAFAFAERLFELEWANDGNDPHDKTSEGPLSRVLSTVTAARILAVEGTLLGCFLALDAATLALFWVGSMLPLWQDTRRSKSRPLHLVMTLAIAGTTAALVAALVLMAQAGAASPFDLLALTQASTSLPPAVGWLFLFAALLWRRRT